jgi:SH3 domain-containing protein
MTLTPEQYDEIAKAFQKGVADPLVPPEGREEFAKKAEWYHFLSQREREAHHLSEKKHIEDAVSSGIPLDLTSSRRQKRSLSPFLTTLWISGAALYFITTLMFAHTINLTGHDHALTQGQPIQPTPAISVNTSPGGSQPTSPSASVAGNDMDEQPVQDSSPHVNGADAGERDTQLMPASGGRHAIALNQPSSDASDVAIPSSPSPGNGLDPKPPGEPIQQDEALESAQAVEMLTVTTAAAIRSAPSTSARKIGRAAAGAELKVVAREGDWVQFTDPASGYKGWIQSSLVAPSSGGETKNVANHQAPTIFPSAKPKHGKQKPVMPPQAMPGQRAFADLPPDEEFMPPRKRRPGLVNRRRIMGEGLMTPGLFPPD